jgi:hypothetical protein
VDPACRVRSGASAENYPLAASRVSDDEMTDRVVGKRGAMLLPCAPCLPILGSSRTSLGARVGDGTWWSAACDVVLRPFKPMPPRAADRCRVRGRGFPMGLGRLWKIPAAVAELTVGTMIVLYQLSVARAVDEKQRRLLDVTRYSPMVPPSAPPSERVASN